MDDFIDFVDWQEEIENGFLFRIRIPKRYIRDQQNPFDSYSDDDFKRRYRFSKLTVRDNILPLVLGRLEKNSNRGLPVLPMLQVFIALRFYATGNFQAVDGDLQDFSQATVHFINKRVSVAIAEHLGEFVRFPANVLDQQNNMQKFFQIAHFPNVSACIDGTHVLIKNPGGEIGEVFRNRKGQFSLNVQVACGPNMEILDIDVRNPGSTHDNVIFERSGLRIRLENNEIAGLILGDNGYACRTYLLTPVINPITRSEQNYNRAHIRTRNIIERVFGIWKRRFPCLRRVLSTKLQTSAAIICATAVLHNIARRQHDNIKDEPDNAEDWLDNIIIEQQQPGGLEFRRVFIVTHY